MNPLPIQAPIEIMMEKMTEGVFIIDKDLKLLIANPSCRKMPGISPIKTISLFDLTAAFKEYFPIEETISQVFKTQEAEKVSEVKVDGKFFQVSVIPIEISDGAQGVGVLLHDQTEEQKLRHQHESFMAMLVHELRSPLTVIKGMADMLVKNPERFNEAKKNEILTQIESSANQLLEMVNTTLEDAREDDGKFEVHKKKGDLNALIKSEVQNYEGLAKERKLSLTFDLDSSLPSFEFDTVKVTQVMNNLLSNAIKFTQEGGISVLTKLEEKNMVRVEVVDTGEGIPADKKSQLFHKFVQLHEPSDPEMPSTGLGLVITKGIVEAHGGKIWIEDNKPKGTKLIFTLPVIL